MSAPLLSTKLSVPPTRAAIVARPQLSTRLDTVAHYPLTLITAPAGFGKTTLVGNWVAQSESLSIAWVSLDEDDNDPLRFWVYVLTALQRLRPNLGENALALLQSPEPPPLTHCLTTFINELADVADPLVLVLDDYHLVTNPVLHTALTFLLDHQPACLHLVLVTRSEPPGLPLARLRARDQLLELRINDLAFTLFEATTFLNEVMQLDLTQDQVALLEQRTEGWVAGLQFAALSLRGRSDFSAFLAAFTGSHRHILDYLIHEVLQCQPPQVRHFLLHTASLDQLCASLCSNVLNDPEWTEFTCQTMLERLEQANLFLIPLDTTRQWYRYHHLFAEALRAQLTLSGTVERTGLYQRASLWYESRNEVDKAIRFALTAQDFERAADLIEHRTAWWVRNEVRTVTGWLAALPETTIRARPRLLFNQVWSLLSSSQANEAETWLRDLDLDDPETPWPAPQRAWFKAEMLTLRSAIARHRRDIAGAIRYGRDSLDLMHPAQSDLRAVTAMHLGNAYLFQADLSAATDALTHAVETALASGHATVYLHSQHSLALIELMKGKLRAAEAIYLQARHFVSQQPRPILTGLDAIGLSDVYREWNEIQKAEALLAEGLTLAEKGGGVPQIRVGYLVAARLKQAQGNWASAESYLERATQLTPESGSINASIVALSRARLALALGNISAARHWVRSFPGATEIPAFIRDLESAVLTRLAIATADHAHAEKLLDEWRAATEKGGRAGRTLEANLLLAGLHWKQGRQSVAQKLIGDVLTSAMPEGYVRLFVDEGPPMLALLTAFSQQASPALVPYVQKLLAAFPASPPFAMLPEPLSEREIEVLRLLAAGHSYREIAQTLVLAVSTVQSYIRNLYRKLGVHSGREAIARARALHLIA